MPAETRKAIVRFCDVVTPLAFLAAAAAMFLPFARIHFAGAAPAVYSGIDLLFKGSIFADPAQAQLVNELLSAWWLTIAGMCAFAAIGTLAVVIRLFGSEAKKKIFEKIELGIGVLGIICVGILMSDAADLEIRKTGAVVFLHGMWFVAGAYLAAMLSAATVFFLEFPRGGEYRVGTLVYDNRGLMNVFVWILWGDFFFAFLQSNVVFSVLPIQLHNLGFGVASMAILAGTIPSALGSIVAPAVGYRSDRLRSRWGRRIPYMVVTAPLAALFLVLMGFAGPIKSAVETSSLVVALRIDPSVVATGVVGAIIVGFWFFYDFVGTVYYPLFVDVVPQEVMGRFYALFRLIGTLAGIIFNAFVFKYAETHVTAIYIWTAAFFIVGVTLMCLKVKEGQYPPPEDEPEGRRPPVWMQIRNYFVESFSRPVYLAFFLFTLVWAVSNACMLWRTFFFLENAGLTVADMGRVSTWSGLITMVLMYPAGMLIDRFKPLPVLTYCTVLYLPATFIGYYIHDFTSYAVIMLLNVPLWVVWETVAMTAQLQVMDKEKMGQLMSANGLVRSTVRIVLPLAGAWFLASTAQDILCLKPGEAVKLTRERTQWKQEVVAVAGRTPGQMLEAEGSIRTNSFERLISAIIMQRTLNLEKENKNYYQLDPAGADRVAVLPGADRGKWFYLGHAGHGGTITIRVPRWQYIWIWQTAFMTLGLGTIVLVWYLWARDERRRGAR